jgi:hypothetical protein
MLHVSQAITPLCDPVIDCLVLILCLIGRENPCLLHDMYVHIAPNPSPMSMEGLGLALSLGPVCRLSPSSLTPQCEQLESKTCVMCYKRRKEDTHVLHPFGACLLWYMCVMTDLLDRRGFRSILQLKHILLWSRRCRRRNVLIINKYDSSKFHVRLSLLKGRKKWTQEVCRFIKKLEYLRVVPLFSPLN